MKSKLSKSEELAKLKKKLPESKISVFTSFSPSTRSGQAKKLRVQILDAHLEGLPAKERLVIDTVKPEGKKEMSYEAFLRSGARPT